MSEKLGNHYLGRTLMTYFNKQNVSFCVANAIKYVARCEHKNQLESDLKKALDYLLHAQTMYDSGYPLPQVIGNMNRNATDMRESMREYDYQKQMLQGEGMQQVLKSLFMLNDYNGLRFSIALLKSEMHSLGIEVGSE